MNNNEVPVEEKTSAEQPTAQEVVEQVANQPTVEEVKYEEAESNPTSSIVNGEVRTDSYFDGKVLDLIGWKLLCALITGVTASIAYPWGRCMVISYITNHTVLNGKRLKFEGSGGNLFVQRFKWIFFTIITLGIYGLWVPVKETNWIISNIHFEDEPLTDGDSYFDGKFYQLYGINLLTYLLNVCSCGILLPFTMCMKYRWLAKHAVINKKKVVFDGKAMSLFGHYILWIFLTIITFGIYSFWLQVKLEQWKVKNTHLKVVGEEYKKDTSVIALSALVIVVIIIIASLIPAITQLINGNPVVESELKATAPIAAEEALQLYLSGQLDSGDYYDINTLNAFKNLEYDVTGEFNYISYADYVKFISDNIYFSIEATNYHCHGIQYKMECEYEFLDSVKEKINGLFNGRSSTIQNRQINEENTYEDSYISPIGF